MDYLGRTALSMAVSLVINAGMVLHMIDNITEVHINSYNGILKHNNMPNQNSHFSQLIYLLLLAGGNVSYVLNSTVLHQGAPDWLLDIFKADTDIYCERGSTLKHRCRLAIRCHLALSFKRNELVLLPLPASLLSYLQLDAI